MGVSLIESSQYYVNLHELSKAFRCLTTTSLIKTYDTTVFDEEMLIIYNN